MLFVCSTYHSRDDDPIDVHKCDQNEIGNYLNHIKETTDKSKPLSVEINMEPVVYNLRTQTCVRDVRDVKKDVYPKQGTSPSVIPELNAGD